MSVYVLLFTVAIPAKYTSEFCELLQLQTYTCACIRIASWIEPSKVRGCHKIHIHAHARISVRIWNSRRKYGNETLSETIAINR